MIFNRFFKQPKANKFGYTPVYYDERKEDRDRKARAAKREGKEDSEQRDSIDFRSNFRNEVSKNREKSLNQFRSKGNAKSNKMLIVIMLIIAGIIYVQFML
ncbi:MAG: hypothetical protein ACI8RY_000055 [Urechidicola sp.]|jgi:hypothetical protein|tara:strand:- start:5010 stop:5312 length:303 start_codon:yes stop_codon:yes gene_type:complete